ncbi:MAG: tetratricopeptide repeat protein [Gemmatimonas sp.]|nr:tetratricopeptide repeat protein [Gemmatimonas sp.]
MTTLEHARSLAADRKWAELAQLADSVDPETVGRSAELAYLLADALRRTGHLDRARPLAGSAERSAFRTADTRLALRTLNLLGMLAFEAGSMDEAETAFGSLLERATETADDEFAARASNNLGIIANIRGNSELALTSYQRATVSYHRIGYARGLAQTYYNMGISYRDLGFPDEADSHFDRAVQYADESNSEDVVALAETERAALRAQAGDGQLAESIASRALARLERMKDPAGAANAVRVLANAARSRGAHDLALQRLDAALSTLDAHPDLLVRAEIQRDRGSLLAALGSPANATDALLDAVRAYQRLGATVEAEAMKLLLSQIEETPPSL